MSSKSLESSSRLLMKAIVTRSLLLNDNVLDKTNLESELIENESLTQTKNNFTFNFIQDVSLNFFFYFHIIENFLYFSCKFLNNIILSQLMII